jgi:hypothetical protein
MCCLNPVVPPEICVEKYDFPTQISHFTSGFLCVCVSISLSFSPNFRKGNLLLLLLLLVNCVSSSVSQVVSKLLYTVRVQVNCQGQSIIYIFHSQPPFYSIKIYIYISRSPLLLLLLYYYQHHHHNHYYLNIYIYITLPIIIIITILLSTSSS